MKVDFLLIQTIHSVVKHICISSMFTHPQCKGLWHLFSSHFLPAIMLLSWLMKEVCVEEGSVIPTKQLYFQYVEEMSSRGVDALPQNKFGQYVNKLFNTKGKEVRNKGTKHQAYVGIGMREAYVPTFDFHQLTKHVGDGVLSQRFTNKITIMLCTKYKVNGMQLFKEVTFFNDQNWTLSMGGKEIDPKTFQLQQSYCDQMVQPILDVVDKIGVCIGKERPKILKVSKLLVEDWQFDGTSQHRVRTPQCTRVLSITATSNACQSCQNVTLRESKNHVGLDKDDTQDINAIIDTLLPNSDLKFKNMVLEQRKHQELNDPKGMRWDKNFLHLCLSLYVRSPSTYKELQGSGYFRLPSGRLLSYYKNNAPQSTGICHKILEWMYNEATRMKIPPHGWAGGIILDEMSIQEDLQFVRSGSYFKLSGFTDMGAENDSWRQLRQGNNDVKLANHVLQLHFLGMTGFRFPVAHFPTTQATASDLNTIFWSAVENMESYGFCVEYVNMDGAITNRQFLKMNFPSGTPQESLYVATSPVCPLQKLCFIMDISHTIKKIRNSINSSAPNGTRLLQCDSGQILWQFWRDAYEWDSANPFQIHRHLSRNHIELDGCSKMRNHLAEQVLDEDMLHLMTEYQKSLGENGEHLAPSLALLTNTSCLIKVFRDPRPVSDVADTRLNQIEEVKVWFSEWEKKIGKSKNLMTDECREDLQSSIVGFVELCKQHLAQFPASFIVPSRINSDVIENHFSQQRGLHNGANTNPNYATYSKTNNSIIIGQPIISKKANTKGNGLKGAQPVSFTSPAPLEPKRKRKSKRSSVVPIKHIKIDMTSHEDSARPN